MKIIFYFIFIISLFGCKKLTNVIDREPPNNLVPENVVNNVQDARNLLNGAYAMLNDQYYYLSLPEKIPALMAGTSSLRTGSSQFQLNAVLPDLAELNSCWVALYKLINQANWVIKLVAALPNTEITDAERQSIIGQALALRAMGHFDALRFYGQHFDVNSKYGVVILTEPSNFTTRHVKRSTVAEVYNQILTDLDAAIEKAPVFSKSIYMSKTAAKALKARVLLHKGDYTAAATVADDVIVTGGRTLSPTYARVFSDGFAATDMIFMRGTDTVSYTADRKKFTYGNLANVASTWFKTLMTGDPRIAATYTAATGLILKVNNVTFFATTYYIRLAEVYLIKAEALARSGAALTDAKAPLLTVKTRAYGTAQTSPATTIDQLLDEIFNEYIKELAFENGTELTAAIRFNKLKTIKPSVLNVNQYILPIPETELSGNNLFGEQNPGY
jgi:starch-binding outer membrane protein, SusD/RagB family